EKESGDHGWGPGRRFATAELASTGVGRRRPFQERREPRTFASRANALTPVGAAMAAMACPAPSSRPWPLPQQPPRGAGAQNRRCLTDLPLRRIRRRASMPTWMWLSTYSALTLASEASVLRSEEHTSE